MSIVFVRFAGKSSQLGDKMMDVLDDWWAGGLKAVWMKAEKLLSVGGVSMHPHWVRRCDAS